MQKKPTALIVLDGFGFSEQKKYNAIAQANTPHLSAWFSDYPHAQLQAAGTAVGLPPGYIGNSEVGHSTIGAGRVIKQSLAFINEAIKNGSFFSNTQLDDALNRLKKNGGTLHLIGLLSDAGVHSHIDHLIAYIEAAIAHGIKHIVIHPILDGRDTFPRSGITFLQQLEKKIASFPQVTIGSMHGRYYAMDRNQNWDRTQASYQVLTQKNLPLEQAWQSILKEAYATGLSDEFILPIQLNDEIIQSGDGIIFFNFRPERLRQLASAFVDPTFNHFATEHLALSFFLTPFTFDSHKTASMFALPSTEHTLLDILQEHHYSLFTIAETEKYAHVTYFFSGGIETKRENETRTLIPSIKTKTYEEYPCMSAVEITDAILASLKTNPCDFYLVNYANADMVAHSGNMAATVKAIECLDTQLARVYEQLVERMDGTLYITADHGNAEDMFDEATGQVKTSHTTNPVPFVMINKQLKGKAKQLPLQGLKDIAPFILKNLGLPVPREMS